MGRPPSCFWECWGGYAADLVSKLSVVREASFVPSVCLIRNETRYTRYEIGASLRYGQRLCTRNDYEQTALSVDVA